MKNAGKARSYGLYRHLRTSKEIIENLLNYSLKKSKNVNLQDEVYKNAIVRKLRKIEVYKIFTDFGTRSVKKRKIFS